jgi:hypothetical protein
VNLGLDTVTREFIVRTVREASLWREFESARPLILGALLDAVVHGLRESSIGMNVRPRLIG